MPSKQINLKTFCKSALSALLVFFFLQANATDFALTNSAVTAGDSSGAFDLRVDRGGMVSGSVGQGTNENYGMPFVRFKLEANNIQTGDHVFWAALEIEAADGRYLRAFVDEVYMTVANDGSFTGSVLPSTNLAIRMEGVDEFLLIELEDQAEESIRFIGQFMVFDARELIDLVETATGRSDRWRRIAADFNKSSRYSYKIYLGPRDYGVQGAQIGLSEPIGFIPFPLTPATFHNNDEAYVIRGEFFVSYSTTSRPVLSNVIGPAGAGSVTVRGGVREILGLGYYKLTSLFVGDPLRLLFSVSPAPGHIGRSALLILAVVSASDPNTLYLLSNTGELVPYNGAQIIGATQLTLESDNIFNVFPNEAPVLTADLRGSYEFYFGYLLLETGELFYSAEPVFLKVN